MYSQDAVRCNQNDVPRKCGLFKVHIHLPGDRWSSILPNKSADWSIFPLSPLRGVLQDFLPVTRGGNSSRKITSGVLGGGASGALKIAWDRCSYSNEIFKELTLYIPSVTDHQLTSPYHITSSSMIQDKRIQEMITSDQFIQILSTCDIWNMWEL